MTYVVHSREAAGEEPPRDAPQRDAAAGEPHEAPHDVRVAIDGLRVTVVVRLEHLVVEHLEGDDGRPLSERAERASC